MRQLLLHVAGALVILAGGFAAAAGEAPTHACSAVPDPQQRLSCFDKAFPAKPVQAPSAAQSVNQSAPVTQAPKPLPAQEFGFTDAQRREKAADDRKADTSPAEIRTTVTTWKKRPNGTFVTTLENGQVWSQIELNSNARLKPGDAVVIHKAVFGSYVLVTPAGIGTRVQRVR
ncbi:MAG: hypothetical protein WDO56_01165 [Gammaproteobacteria bacterium]